ncbi:MAG: hypothetical protein H6739_16765 [Alphaproteobacteria bacterium]|nr:hypothetical protein [Alphaproteobacteria bacterium]
MWTLLLPIAAAGTLPPGEPIPRAAALHVSNAGLAHMGDAVEGLVPPSFPVADIYGSFECDEADEDPLTYSLGAIDLYLAAQDVALVAADGELHLTLYLTLSSSASQLDVTGDCSFLQDLEETCGVAFPTTSVVADLSIAMALYEGNDGVNYIDVTASDPAITISPIGNPLSDCVLADAIGTLLGTNEEAISALLLSFVEPELEGLGAEIETSLEDALNGLVLETSFGLGEGEVALTLEPSSLELTEAGLVLGLGATSVPSFISDCVDAGEGSASADAPWPDFSERAWDTSLEYDAAIFVNKDFVDHVLWGVWATGALCLDVSTAVEGLTLDTQLFSNLFGESFAALFDENDPKPVNIVTAPDAPPTIGFQEDGAPFALQLREFGLNFSAPLDDRETRLFRADVVADVGIDPGLGATELAPAVIIDTEAIQFEEPYNELVEPGFSEGLADFLPTVLGTVLPDDLLPTVAIPSILGIGLDTVFWLPDADGQWMGGFILLDIDNVQPLEVAGCEGGSFGCDGFEGETDPFDFETLLGCGEDSAGCGADSAGCEDTGCTTQHRRRFWPGWRFGLGFFALVLASLRRRG